MNIRHMFLLLFCSLSTYSQQMNVKNFGAKGDGKSDDTPAFIKAIAEINKNNNVKKTHTVLFIPSGEYNLSKPIILNKYISLEGEFVNATIIRISSPQCEGIILEDNKDEKDISNGYNSIKNISVFGPDYGKNPFAWKNTKLNNTRSVGIKILGLRNRVENCIVDGFLWSGIEITASYYNFITKNFIRNNRIGITVDKTSTSAFINNNEIRTNAIGVFVQNQSYAVYINNNIIESNIANFLEPDKNEANPTAMTTGKGILIKNANTVFIQNNYFEQHYINLAFFDADNNEVSSNFIALINLNNTNNQNLLMFNGKLKNNKLVNNQTIGATAEVDDSKMIIPDNEDYSSNSFDFGKEKNSQIKAKLQKTTKNTKNMPQFPN
jgi:hypothetical protein